MAIIAAAAIAALVTLPIALLWARGIDRNPASREAGRGFLTDDAPDFLD